MRRARWLLINPWAAHVSPRSTVVEMVEHLVATGVLQKDKRQLEMAALCSPLLDAVREAQHPAPQSNEPQRLATLRLVKEYFVRLAAKYQVMGSSSKAIDVQWPVNVGPAPVSSGLYIWGDVGIGKTMILDLFELCATPNLGKRRAHLHSFMTMLSDRLHQVEMQQRSTSQPRDDRRRPIEIVVDEIVTETPILCFDEFQTFDVAHASLLAAFFQHAFAKGIFLITTSNRPPHELFHLSCTFQEFLPLLYRHCNVVHCRDIQDYRVAASQRGSMHHYTFLSPNAEEHANLLMHRIERGLRLGGESPSTISSADKGAIQAAPPWEYNVRMPIYGREAIVPMQCGGVAVFDFCQICGKEQMLGPEDFQMFAKTFHTIVIFNVPQIGTVAKNAAKQFIVLVDEMYQHKVKLFCTSSVPWERLFDVTEVAGVPREEDQYAEGNDERSSRFEYEQQQCSQEEILSFGRVLSRLHEMGSVEYLFADHIHFKITDFNIGSVLTG